MSILAAQYVRMSTDFQQYSIENQKARSSNMRYNMDLP